LITVREFNNKIKSITGKDADQNKLFRYNIQNVLVKDYIKEEKETLDKIEIKNNMVVCSDCRIEKIEENIKAICYPFVFEIDHWSHITSQGKLIIFESTDSKICSICGKSPSLPDEVWINGKWEKPTKENYQEEKYMKIITEPEQLEQNKFETDSQEPINQIIQNKEINIQGSQHNFEWKNFPARPDNKPYDVLSFGVGQDSITEFLTSWYKYDLIIFADTGNEQKETYEYLEALLREIPIEAKAKLVILKENHLGSIYDYYYEKKLLPMPYSNRQCTDKFKVRPIRQFLRGRKDSEGIFTLDAKFVMNICINYSEVDRARYSESKDNTYKTDVSYIRNRYPLIEKKITRKDEKAIILRTKLGIGLGIPVKSGCKICPFTSKVGYQKMKQEHPDDYKQVVDLIKNSTARTNSYNLVTDETMDQFFQEENQKMKENRCSCFTGDFKVEEPDENETMKKTNSW